jgi:hypothetical protein
MAFDAMDGSKHTNMSTMKSANASHMAKAPMAAPANPDQGGDILQSPEVQQVFQALAAAGVSPDEVAQAYAQVSGDGQEMQEAPQA